MKAAGLAVSPHQHLHASTHPSCPLFSTLGYWMPVCFGSSHPHTPYFLGKLRGRTGIFPSSYVQSTTRPALHSDLISVEEVCSLTFNHVSVQTLIHIDCYALPNSIRPLHSVFIVCFLFCFCFVTRILTSALITLVFVFIGQDTSGQDCSNCSEAKHI